METLRAMTGWILFLIMAILAAFFWHQSDIRGKRIEELTVRIMEIDAQITRLTDEIIALSERMKEDGVIPGSAESELPHVEEGAAPPAPQATPIPAPAP